MNWVFRFLIFLFATSNLPAQYPEGKYRVQLSDKENNNFILASPEAFLSNRSLQRRKNQNIRVDFTDLPVSQFYLDSMTRLGIPVLNTSRWFNSVTTDNIDSSQVMLLLHQRFVTDVVFLKPAILKEKNSTSGIRNTSFETGPDYGYGLGQIALNKGDKLHEMGYTGNGMQIAIIDAGFRNADVLPAFYSLWNDGRILGWRDFVEPENNVFNAHPHGTYVLSDIGSYIPGFMIGTAPDASFWLLRSEDTETEYLIEEDNWVSAAEYADSAGADVINTSLGYTTFDDSAQNHTYQDMNGHTTRISVAAGMAASKGMILAVSAGNDGNKDWRYIGAPADADSILAVGAVSSAGVIAPFSSHGPSSDGRIKPDVCAMGWGTYIFSPDGSLGQGNGTSLSAPVISGLLACLWQANPRATNMQIRQAVLESSDRFEDPDTLYGYGIPDFYTANLILKSNFRSPFDTTDYFTLFPNPFHYEFYLSFDSPSDTEVFISAYNQTGALMSHFTYPVKKGYNLILINDLSGFDQGIYILKIQSGSHTAHKLVIK